MSDLPNLLSFLRIALVPFLVYCLTDTDPVSSLMAAGIFFIACLTDYFDGYLARKHGQTTILGTFLDPLADKLLVMAVPGHAGGQRPCTGPPRPGWWW